MKKLMIKESTQTIKAKQLKPGMKTAQGVIKTVVHDYLHGKPGVNVNYSTNGHAISDWFYDDKDVEIEPVKESKSIKESYSGPYTERMFEYMDICDRQGLYDLCISFIKWMGDDELGQFARANDMTTVFEESKQPTTGKLNIKED